MRTRRRGYHDPTWATAPRLPQERVLPSPIRYDGPAVTFQLDLIQTIGLSTVVLFLGYGLNARIGFLREHNLPEPVVGGLAFAGLTTLAHLGGGLELHFDMSLRNPMMLTFFTSVGLGASLKMLKRGGPQVVSFLAISSVFLVVQNTVGVLAAWAVDLHPACGLLAGSITLSGGHGTGAVWAEVFARTRNLRGAMELAMAAATFGLVLGGLIGGPVARFLIERHRLSPEEAPPADPQAASTDPDAAVTFDPEDPDTVTPLEVLRTLFVICLCISTGGALRGVLAGMGIPLPVFLLSLLVGVAVTNLAEATGRWRLNRQCIDLLGTLGLSLFLCMSLMSLRLWELASLAGPMLAVLCTQTAAMAAFAALVTFRFMGADYDAAIMAGGHCGFGLGATPTAVANMEAVTSRFGPSPRAFLVVSMVGAFFIDIVNAMVIQAFLSLPGFHP